jgi:FkbM family methyltransferase
MLGRALRSLIRRPVYWAASRLGYRLYSVGGLPYGIDVWLDVERLAKSWGIELATMFDVGANVGQTALSMKKRWPNARIVCFEPTGATFKKLQENIRPLLQVEAHNIALGNAPGVVDLFTYENTLINSLLPDAQTVTRFEAAAKKETCTVRTLDEVLRTEKIRRINLLKIDTEGYDLPILEGAANSLQEGLVDFIYVEFNTIMAKAGSSGGALAPLASFLAPFRFHFVAAYTDYVVMEGDFFSVSNALFARH